MSTLEVTMLVYIILGVLGALVLLLLATCLVCFRLAFYAPKKAPLGEDEFDIPPGKAYEPYRERMIAWMKEMRAMPHEDVSIVSHDGLRLCAKYYEYQKGAPMEIVFHGYRGSAERDLCGAIGRCFAIGRNALIVDQRTSGDSEGHVISFGINERHDCRRWVDFAIEHYGADVKIVLTSISMGAATVMMAAGEELPPNVIGVLADCGYTSAKEIIGKVIRHMGLSAPILYPIVRLSGRLFGGFDVEETSPIEAMGRCRVPVIFYHGEADGFVPCDMSVRLHEACVATKRLVIVPGADHGLAYPADKEGYLRELRDFEIECGHV